MKSKVQQAMKSVLIGWRLIVGLTLLVTEATPAWPQASAALSANELAKEISNPVPASGSSSSSLTMTNLRAGISTLR